jgi:exodeoxyribonuclease VIII
MPVNGLVSMPEAEYHAHPAMSQSKLKEILRSPAHFKWELDSPPQKKEAMEFGTWFHSMVLEPHKDAFVTPPDDWAITEKGAISKKNKGYAEWVEANKDKYRVSPAQLKELDGMRDAIRNHGLALPLLSSGVAEQSAFFDYEGVPMRSRFDWVSNQNFIVDLKTVRDAREEAFTRDCFQLGYDIQAATYKEAFERATGEQCLGVAFICVEKLPPYGVMVYQVTQEVLELGKHKLDQAVATYKGCLATGKYPCYPESINYLELPEWQKKKKDRKEIAQ